MAASMQGVELARQTLVDKRSSLAVLSEIHLLDAIIKTNIPQPRATRLHSFDWFCWRDDGLARNWRAVGLTTSDGPRGPLTASPVATQCEMVPSRRSTSLFSPPFCARVTPAACICTTSGCPAGTRSLLHDPRLRD